MEKTNYFYLIIKKILVNISVLFLMKFWWKRKFGYNLAYFNKEKMPMSKTNYLLIINYDYFIEVYNDISILNKKMYSWSWIYFKRLFSIDCNYFIDFNKPWKGICLLYSEKINSIPYLDDESKYFCVLLNGKKGELIFDLTQGKSYEFLDKLFTLIYSK